jgi:hypothetical protein
MLLGEEVAVMRIYETHERADNLHTLMLVQVVCIFTAMFLSVKL